MRVTESLIRKYVRNILSESFLEESNNPKVVARFMHLIANEINSDLEAAGLDPSQGEYDENDPDSIERHERADQFIGSYDCMSNRKIAAYVIAIISMCKKLYSRKEDLKDIDDVDELNDAVKAIVTSMVASMPFTWFIAASYGTADTSKWSPGDPGEFTVEIAADRTEMLFNELGINPEWGEDGYVGDEDIKAIIMPKKITGS